MTPLQCLAFWPEASYKRWQELCQQFGADDWWTVGAEAATPLPWSPKVKQSFRVWRNQADAVQFSQQLTADAIVLITYSDPAYPKGLRELAQPPLALFVRGRIPASLCLAAVGTRRPTEYGQRATSLIIPPLARAGLTIVSGLAYGLDALAHRLTLDAGGSTVAVLGTGVDRASIHPIGNQSLAERIIASGGAVISELPPGTPGSKITFPLRNRIIAGLCDVTLVLEAPIKSGALITADCADQLQRTVACVPHPITSVIGAGGNHWLATQGSVIVTTPDDILLQYPGIKHRKIRNKKIIIEPHLRALLEVIPKNGRHLNEIIQQLNQPIAQVMSMISELELSGAIADLGGNHYARC